jgi:hypothetical protein
MMRALVVTIAVAALTGCTTTERQASIQKASLAEVVATFPVGMQADAVHAVSLAQRWEVRADQPQAHWPLSGDGPAVDRVFSIMLPKRAGVPFSIFVFAFVGAKDGKVVGHQVVVEANAL